MIAAVEAVHEVVPVFLQRIWTRFAATSAAASASDSFAPVGPRTAILTGVVPVLPVVVELATGDTKAPKPYCAAMGIDAPVVAPGAVIVAWKLPGIVPAVARGAVATPANPVDTVRTRVAALPDGRWEGGERPGRAGT